MRATMKPLAPCVLFPSKLFRIPYVYRVDLSKAAIENFIASTVSRRPVDRSPCCGNHLSLHAVRWFEHQTSESIVCTKFRLVQIDYAWSITVVTVRSGTYTGFHFEG